MRIDPNSPIPLFQQIADYVRRAIAAGIHRPNETIPSLRSLAVELTINPNTVQRAYESLEREGLIEARKGLGMFVTANGAALARRRSEKSVYASFNSGIRAGMSANMTARNIRGTFDKAWKDCQPEADKEK